MPRKYRPPASSKRRKPRTVEYDFPTAPEDASTETAVADEAAEDYEDDDIDYADEAVIETRTPTGRSIADRPERHVRRDYSYVRSDVIRIGIFAAVLIVAIIIGGIIR
ncbi:MAG TPA: hypothetical protein VMR52_11565 [Dehalococcoidia bacterium]|nr:hypothetical protein [Dehalococcoidia bacterium]